MPKVKVFCLFKAHRYAANLTGIEVFFIETGKLTPKSIDHVCEPRLKLAAPEAHSLTLGTLIYFRHFSSL